MGTDMRVREEQAMNAVAERLAADFSGRVPAGRVAEALVKARQRFADRPIREFVPIFAERLARQALGSETSREGAVRVQDAS